MFSAYTSFDADKTCKHTSRARDWRITAPGCVPAMPVWIVRLSAGDQRMQVSFGRDPRQPPARSRASQTFPGFQFRSIKGTIEWRMERLPNGKARPFATILRWNTRTAADAEREDGKIDWPDAGGDAS